MESRLCSRRTKLSIRFVLESGGPSSDPPPSPAVSPPPPPLSSVVPPRSRSASPVRALRTTQRPIAASMSAASASATSPSESAAGTAQSTSACSAHAMHGPRQPRPRSRFPTRSAAGGGREGCHTTEERCTTRRDANDATRQLLGWRGGRGVTRSSRGGRPFSFSALPRGTTNPPRPTDQPNERTSAEPHDELDQVEHERRAAAKERHRRLRVAAAVAEVGREADERAHQRVDERHRGMQRVLDARDHLATSDERRATSDERRATTPAAAAVQARNRRGGGVAFRLVRSDLIYVRARLSQHCDIDVMSRSIYHASPPLVPSILVLTRPPHHLANPPDRATPSSPPHLCDHLGE